MPARARPSVRPPGRHRGSSTATAASCSQGRPSRYTRPLRDKGPGRAAATPEGHTAYIEAEMADMDSVLGQAAQTLDLDQPVALTLLGILGHVEDPAEAAEIVRRYMARLPSGSHLVTCDSTQSPGMLAAQAAYADSGAARYHEATSEQIEAQAERLTILPPGVSPVSLWRPDEPYPAPVHQTGLVAIKP
ncbi:SAM-dependent methyltransferase [Streptomyces xiamenensis]|uniref:SAM-dependent methyltransferase n=1 Tax=Streptomyces xiamenensis TaxID=408015 RepID=UPI0035E363BD